MNCDHGSFKCIFFLVHIIEVQGYNRLLLSNYVMKMWNIPRGVHR